MGNRSELDLGTIMVGAGLVLIGLGLVLMGVL
jgi:hypothetical protein